LQQVIGNWADFSSGLGHISDMFVLLAYVYQHFSQEIFITQMET